MTLGTLPFKTVSESSPMSMLLLAAWQHHVLTRTLLAYLFPCNPPVRDFLGEDVPVSYLETIIDDADLKRDKR